VGLHRPVLSDTTDNENPVTQKQYNDNIDPPGRQEREGNPARHGEYTQNSQV
jgi:hypothetical protein